MGLDDRDYMRARRGSGSKTRWNDTKGRVEQDGTWFAARNRGQDYQKRPVRQTHFKVSRASLAIAGLSFLAMAIPLYSSAQRNGLIPDFATAEPFPQSGSVTVSPLVKKRRIRSWLTVTTSEANAVVQMYDSDSGAHLSRSMSQVKTASARRFLSAGSASG